MVGPRGKEDGVSVERVNHELWTFWLLDRGGKTLWKLCLSEIAADGASQTVPGGMQHKKSYAHLNCTVKAFWKKKCHLKFTT